MIRKLLFPLILIAFLLGACSSNMQPTMILPTVSGEEAVEEVVEITPFPTRPAYAPGELVDYIAQTGDTLPALAVRFNSTEEEIRQANTFIPEDATTMPPGMPMKIPIYNRPLWGTPYQILPDAAFVNGPDVSVFDTQAFIEQQQGWICQYTAWAFDGTRTAGDIIDHVAINYSVSPKLLLALLDYQGGAFKDGYISVSEERNILGLESDYWTGVYLQLSYAANILNDGYYRWREGDLIEFELEDGSLVRPDPWQNAGTVALQYFFSQTQSVTDFQIAIGPDGLVSSYKKLFGDPWGIEPHLPGSLAQPEMLLPYETDKIWAYTGGPHTGWGSMAPWAALDFAPPSSVTGCYDSSVHTTAVADGLIIRDGEGILVLDLDGDGDEHTGWVVFYLHVAARERVPVGTVVKAGDSLGYPSCEGGRSTGTHVHIARKFNGEWMVADGVVPFKLSGWVPERGNAPYKGWLLKGDMRVLASDNPDYKSMIPLD